MKITLFSISFIFSASVYAAESVCMQFAEGPKEVTIGWFNKQTYTVDTVCIPETYPTAGFSENFNFVLKSGTEIVVEYPAVAERYSETDVRFTLMNGEPEPQQFNAIVTKKSKSIVELDFSGYLIPLSSGGLFECTEITDKVGAIRKLKLTQIEASTQWLLEVFSVAVVPNAVPTLEVSSVLTVSEIEDVNFNLKNIKENITYNIYMDELYQTYLYLNSEENIDFDCENN